MEVVFQRRIQFFIQGVVLAVDRRVFRDGQERIVIFLPVISNKTVLVPDVPRSIPITYRIVLPFPEQRGIDDRLQVFLPAGGRRFGLLLGTGIARSS